MRGTTIGRETAGRRTLADDEEPIRWDDDDEDAKEAEPVLEDEPSDGGIVVAPSVTISASSESVRPSTDAAVPTRPSTDAAPKPAAPAPAVAAHMPAPVALGPEVVIVSAPASSTPSPPSMVGSSAAHSKQPSSDDGFELVRQPAAAAAQAGKPQAAQGSGPLPGTSTLQGSNNGDDDDEDDDLLRELDDLPDAPPARTGASAATAADADLGDWE